MSERNRTTRKSRRSRLAAGYVGRSSRERRRLAAAARSTAHPRGVRPGAAALSRGHRLSALRGGAGLHGPASSSDAEPGHQSPGDRVQSSPPESSEPEARPADGPLGENGRRTTRGLSSVGVRMWVPNLGLVHGGASSGSRSIALRSAISGDVTARPARPPMPDDAGEALGSLQGGKGHGDAALGPRCAFCLSRFPRRDPLTRAAGGIGLRPAPPVPRVLVNPAATIAPERRVVPLATLTGSLSLSGGAPRLRALVGHPGARQAREVRRAPSLVDALGVGSAGHEGMLEQPF